MKEQNKAVVVDNKALNKNISELNKTLAGDEADIAIGKINLRHLFTARRLRKTCNEFLVYI